MADESRQGPPGAPTRLIAIGGAALMQGFSLIGAETYPDAGPEALERLLADLLRSEQKALLFLEHHLARSGGFWLNRVRSEGGRIVVTEIPSLARPDEYAPEVDRLVRRLLGDSALNGGAA
ncbi:MAG: V-type ATP synthase subunit F [Pseudomonadota bacterium]